MKDKTILYIVRLTSKNISHEDIHQYLLNNGIAVNLHYIPVYKHPYFDLDFSLDEAEEYYKTAISLPIFPTIKLKELEDVVCKLKNYFSM